MAFDESQYYLQMKLFRRNWKISMGPNLRLTNGFIIIWKFDIFAILKQSFNKVLIFLNSPKKIQQFLDISLLTNKTDAYS